jgi:type II secretion system protein G
MKLREDKGFTLVELMVVVVILGIIAAVALPIYASSQEKARKTSCLQNQKIIHSAAEEYKTVNGTYPENVQKLFDDGFLDRMPNCSSLYYEEIDQNGFTKCPKSEEKHKQP